MGNELNVTIEVGFIVAEKEFLSHFGKVIPERFHLKDRYDPNTGVKLQPTKVVDAHEHTEWSHNGQVFTWFEDFLESLAKEHGFYACRVSDDGDGNCAHAVCLKIPEAERMGDTTYWTRCEIGPGFRLGFALESVDELERLKTLLNSWEIATDAAEVIVAERFY